ncbi:MAG: hypothetical protein ABEK50_05865 [bacterium]
MTRPLAALDLGTNSTRFICVEESDTVHPETVKARGMQVTRLGEGVDDSGEITPRARDRVLDCVRGFDREVNQQDGQWVGAVATSACRRASDSSVQDLFDRIESVTSVRPELISGEREAELIYKGVTSSLPGKSNGQIVDIGGGSTEWITFNSGTLESTESLEIGVVTLYERCSSETRCTPENSDCMEDVLGETLIPRNTNNGPLLCVGGTGTTLASVHLQLETYDPGRVHGTALTRSTINQLYQKFLGEPFETIAREPMVQSGREEVLVPGILILLRSMKLTSSTEVTVSDMGILAGLISEATKT